MSTDPTDFCSPTAGPHPAEPPQGDRIGEGGNRLNLSMLCAQGLQFTMISGLCAILVRSHFAKPTNISTPLLTGAVWKESADSGILIETATRWKPLDAGKRPAIIVKRNAIKVEKLAIADLGQLNANNTYNYTALLAGSHTLFAINDPPGSADLLACELLKCVLGFKKLLVKFLGMNRFDVLELGAQLRLAEAKDAAAIPLTVGWAMPINWTLQDETPKFAGLGLSTRSVLSY